MAAFDRVLSGMTSFDEVLDNIRLGDNVVLKVDNIEEFVYFVQPYVNQAVKDKRNLIYFRFASHPPLVKEGMAKEYHLDPGEGFEQFTIKVHKIIEKEGIDSFYVFDCLSELQVAWAADLMMGSFFEVTCPFLFKLDTVAFFPLIRGAHSFETIARIKETTQLFLDIYSDEKSIYVHPVKVWNRYSATMFLPHKTDRQERVFRTLTDSVSISRYYAVVAEKNMGEDQNLDSWERYFEKSRYPKNEQEEEEILSNLCRMMMTKDEKIRLMFKKFFSLEDYYCVKSRMIGSGKIGGKSCGMLLARSVIAKCIPELNMRMEPHDSFYIGDHVYYTYLVYNDLWDLHIAQKEEDGYYKYAKELSRGIMNGKFPDYIEEQLERMLDYYGQSPIIARSSSMLEDGFGNAFAGKYESVFCANQGTMEERLEKLENALRIVYASTVSMSALEYRKTRNLYELDEQMSILVQRVSGSLHGNDYFFPSAAGVGYSYDTYGCSRNMDPQKGMLRMVYGLGTRAVDRTDSDYPRIIHIDNPEHTYLTSVDERVKFSQRKADVIDLKKNEIVEIPLEEMLKYTDSWYHELVFEHDYNMERQLRERGIRRNVYFGTCSGYVKNKEFLEDMRNILSTLQREYTYPVDIEYTVNSNEDGEYVVCLLQCRPLQTYSADGSVSIPEIPKEKVLFQTMDNSMGTPQDKKLDVVVIVDGEKYYQYPYQKKSEVANLITEINIGYRDTDKNVLLMVPGRIGTSSPELGIPVKFAGISHFCAIVEVDDESSDYAPELSFGSHMFQDLVETEIFYTALFHSGKEQAQYREKLLNAVGNILDIPEKYEHLSEMVKVYDVSHAGLKLYYDIKSGKTLCGVEDE